ncbi:hypothetical protein FZW96_03445 [Bacillus sp. BGMRC 2118]|nr:hypothetical protein FZW96_03445 [Bacillus sp. BGMRC 2118]
MKRNLTYITLTILILITITTIFGFSSNKINKNNDLEKIVISGIENFKPTKENNKDRYLLFYPSDKRTSQKFTIVKEVSTSGNIIKEYEIHDDEFRRMTLHQKPNELGNLYISLFGEAVIENWYYKYDLRERLFKKVSLDYFKFDVGVDHIKHYGKDVLFQNLVSHKTGDQNFDPNTGNFNMSISDYDTKKSFETEYGYAPNWTPLLQLNNRIIYSGSGQVNEEGIPENAFVGLINTENNEVEYTKFDNKSIEYYPVYSNSNYAYIIGDEGKLFVLDKEFKYKTYDVFKGLPKQDYYYINNGTLLLNEDTALHFLFDDEKGTSLGLLKFGDNPTFSLLDMDYIKPEMSYRILYQDIVNNEIFLIESNEESNGHLLILDNKNFNLKKKIPINQNHLLDFVIKL